VRRAGTRSASSDRVRVTLPSDLTLTSDETTGYRLRQIAADTRIRVLLLDGHRVSDVSVRALGLLVATVRIAAAHGATAVVVVPSPLLARFITSLGLAERLLVVDADDEVAEPASVADVRALG
jgi:anti-anti-sigma regulatory factor